MVEEVEDSVEQQLHHLAEVVRVSATWDHAVQALAHTHSLVSVVKVNPL